MPISHNIGIELIVALEIWLVAANFRRIEGSDDLQDKARSVSTMANKPAHVKNNK